MAKVTTLMMHLDINSMLTSFFQHKVADRFVSGIFDVENVNYVRAVDNLRGDRPTWAFTLKRGLEARILVNTATSEAPNFLSLNVENELFDKRELANEEEVWTRLAPHVTEEERVRYSEGYYSMQPGTYDETDFVHLVAKYWDLSAAFADSLVILIANRLQMAMNIPFGNTQELAREQGVRIQYSSVLRERNSAYFMTAGNSSYRKNIFLIWTALYESDRLIKMNNFAQVETSQGSGALTLHTFSLSRPSTEDLIGVWHLSTVDQIPGSGQSKTIVETVRAVMEEMRG